MAGSELGTDWKSLGVIPYGRQDISEEDINAVVEVLRSDWLTQGPKIEEFENRLSSKVGANHAVLVNSATSALHIACLALGLRPGSRLWTTPNTFVASANCGLYCGARVDFVDIDPRTYNMSEEALEAKLVEAEKSGLLPDVVVVVHHSGQPCRMQTVGRLAVRFGFRVIEDASHAVGASYEGDYIGSCRHSDVVVFSFHPVKIITTGEGGAALTNDPEIAARMSRLRSHGVTRESELMEAMPDGPWYYEQIELGFNYRMTDIQAALGLAQLSRLDEFVGRRRELSRRYDELLSGLPLSVPWQVDEIESSRHLYVIRLHLKELNVGRTQVFCHLRESGIGVNVHYIPVHRQPFYQRLGFKEGDFPESEHYYQEAISLPMYSSLTSDDQDEVVRALRAAIEQSP
jgi:UDP-4-amino-4,6-dideoxy-N-acetyl-beta-L-altrosamine transaminase